MVAGCPAVRPGGGGRGIWRSPEKAQWRQRGRLVGGLVAGGRGWWEKPAGARRAAAAPWQSVGCGGGEP